MIYDIRHVSTYTYEGRAASASCALRLLPRGGAGQRVLDARIDIQPRPASERRATDFFGNSVVFVRVDAPHAKLVVESLSRVEVAREAPAAAALTPAWEIIRAAAAASGELDARGPAHFLYPSRLAPLHAEATDYARSSFTGGKPILEGAHDIMRRIRKDFAYDPQATHVATTVAEAFERRHGVCQDFAHVMISALRGLGLPAAYVSGYIRTTPPPGKPRLEGADASHAWVSVWCGPEFGWLGLDPTNDIDVGDDHVVVAVGRDYADVSPIDGVFVGSGAQTISVSVDVRPGTE